MASAKGVIERRRTRKAAEEDAKADEFVKSKKSIAAKASVVEEMQEDPGQPTLRRSKRAAAAAKAAVVDDEEGSPSAGDLRQAYEPAQAQDVSEEDDGKDADDLPGSSSDDDAAELDAFDDSTRQAVDSFEAAVAEPAAFLQPSAKISELARTAAKVLYDLAAAETTTAAAAKVGAGGSAPQQLYVEGFDAEQIWLQLEMQSAGALKRARRLIKKAGDVPRLVIPEMEEALDDLLGNAEESDESGSESDKDEGGAGGDGIAADDMDGEEENEEEEEDSKGDEDEAEQGTNDRQRRAGRPAGAGLSEDRFFQMGDMDRFAEDAELAAMRSDNDEDEDETDDDEDALPAGDPEADSDDGALAAVLDNARKLSGRRAERRERFREDDAEDEGASEGDGDDEAAAAAANYSDWFDDPREGKGDKGDGAEHMRARNGLAADGDLETDGEEEDEEDWEQEGKLGEPSTLTDKTGTGAGGGSLSAHERRMARMAERVAVLERQNMGNKDWFMRGEAAAGSRPLNSALEVDLDFERAVRPPPQPTEGATASLEDLIRARIADHNFDDVPRVAPPAPETRTKTIDMDDKKSGKGLGEIYEEEYVRAAAGNATADDRDEKVRAEARGLVKLLFAKLDALSHFHFAPKPVIEDLSVRADVPALAMEEVAPQVVSEAAMRLPEEVFRAEAKGTPRAAEELSREERRRRRAKKKRSHKSRTEQQAAEKAARPFTQGGTAAAPGRKSAAAEEAAAAAAKAQKKRARQGDAAAVGANAGRGKRVKFGSSAVFGQLQDQREAAAAGEKPSKKSAGAGAGTTSKALKL